MGQGEDHVEIRCVNDFCPAFVHPEFLVDSLAIGTVPVPAGIIVDFCMPAFGADADITAALFRFTTDDSLRSFLLYL